MMKKYSLNTLITAITALTLSPVVSAKFTVGIGAGATNLNAKTNVTFVGDKQDNIPTTSYPNSVADTGITGKIMLGWSDTFCEWLHAGISIDADFSSLKKEFSISDAKFNKDEDNKVIASYLYRATVKTPYSAGVALTLGYHLNPALIVYGKCGIRFTRCEFTETLNDHAPNTTEIITPYSKKKMLFGIEPGIGMQFQYSPKVDIFAEYTHTFSQKAINRENVATVKPHVGKAVIGVKYAIF